jgi:Fe2+ or Zn2+ uptake regulation protein
MKSDAVHLLHQRMQLIEAYWHAQGCRLTVVRKIICECIFVHRNNFNAEQILKEARQLDAAISLTSIYRVIGALKSAQLIEAVLSADKKSEYRWISFDEASSNHIICKNCAQKIELEDPCLPMREGARISEKGFKAHSVKLEPIENLKEQVREVSRAVCGAYQKSY